MSVPLDASKFHTMHLKYFKMKEIAATFRGEKYFISNMCKLFSGVDGFIR